MERNTYECLKCDNETTKCMLCKTSMSRSYGYIADNLCLKCDGTFYGSGKKLNRTDLSNHFCSWCFNKSDHTLYEKSAFGRDVFKCNTCQRTGSSNFKFSFIFKN